MNYVWYACYGSNINKARFMRYINRCEDTTPPAEELPYEFPYPIFFAGSSGIWENKGTAFLDVNTDGHTPGRIYKITAQQYEKVRQLEGPKYRKKVELGTLDNIPVVSFTCEQKPERAIPSLGYFETIVSGLKETYPSYRESAITECLVDSILNADELKILDCLREAEHGLTNRSIAEITGIEVQREREIISTLISLGTIRQDSRSLRFGVDDERAVFYTLAEERELIDRLRSLKREAVEMRSVSADDPLTTAVATEGRRIQYLTSRYERVPANRQAAIRIHGTTCQVCGFNFYEHYGELGRDYIEVHHIKPLSSLDEEVTINPEEDLVCLCANCHRMMHRDRNQVMTVGELKRRFCMMENSRR